MPRSDKLATIGENFAILGELPHSACMSEFDFQPYLSAIVAHYANQRHLYTLTDALLPLEARSVEREEDDREKWVEQFPVLAGLRRYVVQFNCNFYNDDEILDSKSVKPWPTWQSPPKVAYNREIVGKLNVGTVNIHGNQTNKQAP
jgi:hypothetical protein